MIDDLDLHAKLQDKENPIQNHKFMIFMPNFDILNIIQIIN